MRTPRAAMRPARLACRASSSSRIMTDPPTTRPSSQRRPASTAEALSSSSSSVGAAESRADRRRQRMEENTNFAIENDSFKSTNSQRAICAASFGLTALCAAEALSTVDSVGHASGLALSALAAYVLSDLGSGIFHWSVDNYGSGKTPVLGNVIAAFQGHHSEPWTITMREFSNNTYRTCIPTLPFLVLCALDVDHPQWQMFWSLFSSFICLAQQFHSWSHMQKQELPFPVHQLQEAGILISRRAHKAHHREPFENNYCIVSGACNEALDNSGVLQWMENRIYEYSGIKPRCWVEEEGAN